MLTLYKNTFYILTGDVHILPHLTLQNIIILLIYNILSNECFLQHVIFSY